jgi:hypothetical protein
MANNCPDTNSIPSSRKSKVMLPLELNGNVSVVVASPRILLIG